MEGISYEAASFAGNLKLGKLIVLYDANKSSMDTNTNKNFTESVAYRFAAFGWHVENVKNGKSISEINKAIEKVKKRSNALKDIIIPEEKQQIKTIEGILEEREREEFSRLKIIKKTK